MCGNDKFSHLHVHSTYSKDGYGSHELLVKRAKDIGTKYLALTDHGTLSGVISHEQYCNQYEITPIYGNEMYLTIDDVSDPSAKIKANHITVLSVNQKGYRNLVAVNNAAHKRIIQRGNIKFPVSLYKDFKGKTDGLVVLTGCPASLTFHKDYDVAAMYVETLIRMFGEENVFAEIQFTLAGQDFYTRPLALASEFGLESVLTNDTHYPYEGDGDLHMMCTRIKSRATTGSDYSYDSSQLWLKTPQQMWDDAVPHLGEELTERCISNIELITSRVESFSLGAEPKLPVVAPEKVEKLKALLLSLHEQYCLANPKFKEEAVERFEKEFSVIDGLKFWEYIYIVNDIALFARTDGRLSAARGSAAGSYLLYLLEITTVDPLKYGLLFERFLNVERGESLPDVDLDIAGTFRQEVLNYCYEKWGLLQVNTIMTFQHKSLVNDLAKELGIDKDISDRLASIDPDDPEFVKYKNTNKEFGRAYDGMIGTNKTVGKHAAAVASINISGQPLPIEQWGNEPGIAFSESGSVKSLSRVGGVKFDILGIDALDKLARMKRLTNVEPPNDPDAEFPKEIFCSGKLTGIFQFGSSGIRDLTIDVQPVGLEDLTTINALYRPGSLDAGTTEHYVEYRTAPRTFHPDIDKILKPTYSVIVYQEQVMAIFAKITGTGLAGADLARRVLSPKSIKQTKDKKWQKKNEAVRKEFFTKGKANGYSKDLLDHLWDELKTHSRYSFNKSHSAVYADLARRQAWYKLNYPMEFYLATLNALLEAGHSEQMQDYLWEIVKEGYEVVAPSILYSSTKFEVQGNQIYIPLTVVKFFSERNLEALNWLKNYFNGITEIPENSINGEDYYLYVTNKLNEKNVTTFGAEALSFLSKGHTWNKRVKENLAKLGAFRGIDGSEILYDQDVVKNNPFKLQTEAMALIVPDKWYIEREKIAKDRGVTFGIVKKKINKTTKRGFPVVVYLLSGNNVIRFNKDNDPAFSIGTPVVADTNEWGYVQKKNNRYQFSLVYPK